MPSLVPLRRLFPVTIGCIFVAQAGCGSPVNGRPAQSFTLDVEGVLTQCGAAYQKVRTLEKRGVLRDYREEEPRVTSIRWEYQRPDRCRIQIDRDIAVVSGQKWWTYDADDGHFKPSEQSSITAMETAAYILSRKVPFWTPTLLRRGVAAFQINSTHWTEPWRLEGINWFAGRPCYVLSRRERAQAGGEMRLWIDQDSYMLRGWTWSVPGFGGELKVLLGCTYPHIVINGVIPMERFTISDSEAQLGAHSDAPEN